MSNDLEAYFIRHKFGTGNPPNPVKLNAVLKEAWDESFAVIDYQEVTDAAAAFDPNSYGDWPAAKKTLNKINHYLKDGGLLAISSNISHPNKLLIGYLEKAAKGKIHKFRSHPNYFYKVIPLKPIEVVSIRDYPSLFSKIPRQTTFTKWPSAKKTMNQIFRRETPSIQNVEDLDDSQLEIICYEWLRANGKIEYLTLPIGRTLMSIDIVGVDKHFSKVFAQVTFYSDRSTDKINSLKSVSNKPEDALYFFCKGETKTTDGVQYVSIDDVFRFFSNSKNGSNFLNQLIG